MITLAKEIDLNECKMLLNLFPTRFVHFCRLYVYVFGWAKEIAVRRHESSRLSFVEFGCEYFWLCWLWFRFLLPPLLLLFTTRTRTRIHYSLAHRLVFIWPEFFCILFS